jgi:hypothetical protein
VLRDLLSEIEKVSDKCCESSLARTSQGVDHGRI